MATTMIVLLLVAFVTSTIATYQNNPPSYTSYMTVGEGAASTNDYNENPDYYPNTNPSGGVVRKDCV